MSVEMRIIPIYSHRMILKNLENHLILGHLSGNFLPIIFSQYSHSSPQCYYFVVVIVVSSLIPLSSGCVTTLYTLILDPLGAGFCHFEDSQWSVPKP